MKKYLYLITFIFALATSMAKADDYLWGEQFQTGDVISAETFNQIFNTIQKLNRTVIDADLTGAWKCDAMTTRDTEGWADKGGFYILQDAQINFTPSSKSTSVESAYYVSTSTPGPFKRENSSFVGVYQLYKNMMFLRQTGDENARIYSVDIVSPTRVEFTFQETSATSFPSSYSSFITCDSIDAVPAAPTAIIATNAQTSINVTWSDQSYDETGFKIYRRLASETEAIQVGTQVASPYVDNNLTEGQAAYYSVSAYNSNGDSSKSKVALATLDTIPPTVSLHSPRSEEVISRDDRRITISFSEKVDVFCPDGDEYSSDPGAECPTQGGAIRGTVLVNGYARTLYAGQISNGWGGSTTISGTLGVGSAEYLDENQTITIKIDKNWIRDINGNQMLSDYNFSFDVGSEVNDPNCPPNC